MDPFGLLGSETERFWFCYLLLQKGKGSNESWCLYCVLLT